MSTQINNQENNDIYDVFIAYYGDAANGTQCYAEILYDALNGFCLKNSHKLKVYQHTRINPDGRYCNTPQIVQNSRMLLLVADKNIPTESNGALLQRNELRELKRLYEEVDAFRQCHYYRTRYDDSVCCVILADDMSYVDAEKLDTIFTGRVCRRWRDDLNTEFVPLLKMISKFLIGDEELPSKKLSPIPTSTNVKSRHTVGDGAQKRIMRMPNGQCAPYERIAYAKDLSEAQNDGHFINILPPISEPFVPDAEVFADCEKILAYLESTDTISEEEIVFRQFVRDINKGIKESRYVARVCNLNSMGPYERVQIQFQPIEYLWIMKTAFLDTPFNDHGTMTTLRLKYAIPVEENQNFNLASRLACHSGCGVFIVTSDGFLVYQNRYDANSGKISFFPGKSSYTVSGSYLMNSGSVFDFMNAKIERELGNLSQNLYLWEFGYEYDYLHYQFSFFAFCDEDISEFVEYTQPRGAQAKSFSYIDLNDIYTIVDTLRLENWEPSAWAVLINALLSTPFNILLKDKCGLKFNKSEFLRWLRSSH